jgi:glutathione S-transferase
MNPNRLVPTIDDGDIRLWESNVIVRYLAQKHDFGRLCPGRYRNAVRRGAVDGLAGDRVLARTVALREQLVWVSGQNYSADDNESVPLIPHSLHRRRLETFKARADETEMPGPLVVLQRGDGEAAISAAFGK